VQQPREGPRRRAGTRGKTWHSRIRPPAARCIMPWSASPSRG
jgi:hypothetical protein